MKPVHRLHLLSTTATINTNTHTYTNTNTPRHTQYSCTAASKGAFWVGWALGALLAASGDAATHGPDSTRDRTSAAPTCTLPVVDRSAGAV